MKKLILFLISGLIVVLLAGCDATTTTTSTTATTSTTTTTVMESSSTATSEMEADEVLTQVEIDGFAQESVTIHFSYYLPSAQKDAIDAMILAFETKYPNVDIIATRESNSSSVTSNFMSEAVGGVADDLILTRQEFLSIPATAGALLPLEQYFNSMLSMGVDPIGFQEGMLNQTLFTTYASNPEAMLSFPFAREMQVMFVNRDLLAANSIALQNEGVQISNAGFLSDMYALQLADLSLFGNVFSNQTVMVVEKEELTLEHLLHQKYLSLLTDGEYDLEQHDLLSILNDLREFAQDGIITTASHHEESYSSVMFNEGEAVFAISDAESLRYMIEGNTFDTYLWPIPTTSNLSGLFYGSDFAINAASSAAEQFYSWLFIRFATDFSDSYIDFCLDFGWYPIYQPNIVDTNDKYQQYLSDADTYFSSEGSPDWAPDDAKWGVLNLAMLQWIYYFQNEISYPERVIATAITSSEVDNYRLILEQFIEDVMYTELEISSLCRNADSDLNE